MISESSLRELDADGMDDFISSIVEDTLHASTLDYWFKLEAGGYTGYMRELLANGFTSYEDDCPVCGGSPGGCVVCDNRRTVDLFEPRFFYDYKVKEAKTFAHVEALLPELVEVVNMAVYHILINDFDHFELSEELDSAAKAFSKAALSDGFIDDGNVFNFVNHVRSVVRGVGGFAHNVFHYGYKDSF